MMATKEDFDRIGNYARMYNADQNIDRRKCTRQVPMEVLCLGYSRTGTLTMHTALTILGYPSPCHFSSIYDNVRDSDAWMDLMQAKFDGKGTVTKADFDGLLGHCGAVTDLPAILFAAELINYYPEAKVVLVERNIDSWYASWSAFLENAMSPALPMLGRLDPSFSGRIVRIGAAGTNKLVGSAETLASAKARSKEEYRKHYALIRTLVPKDRMLEYELKDGWKPLCKFLGKPVPDQPFPHVNDSTSNGQSFKELAQMSVKKTLRRGTIMSVVVGLGAFAVYWIRATK